MQKTVLITGGAGSLGRAFVRLLEPDQDVIVVDSSEWALAELKGMHPGVECHLGRFADYPINGMEDVVIHLAAYKHVELGESDVTGFVRNNLTDTVEFYSKLQQGITRLLYVSTDKAVEPVSVYGATKFIAERLTYEISGQVARLGNISNSTGSVIPLWEAAIAQNLPIPITDPEMTRYSITADEAAEQVWAQFMAGRRLIVPDMGEPKRILDMMAEVLFSHGYLKASHYGPGVTVIGRRPGEKVHEKLLWDRELAEREIVEHAAASFIL